MGRRAYKRLKIALPVTISGLDTNGNPFRQTATTVEISPRGLRLRGVDCLRGRGDPVQVQYKNRHAQYRVTWIGGLANDRMIGLEGLDDARFLFAQHLESDVHASPNPEADTYVVPTQVVAPEEAVAAAAPIPMEVRKGDRRQQQERRRNQRYHCAGTARIWEGSNEHAITRRMNELSRGGCYVETMSPAPAGSAVRLDVVINGRILHLESIVRNSQLSYGMGLEFVNVAPAEREKLNQVIAELSGEAPLQPLPPPPPPPPPPPVVKQVAGNDDLGEAVQRWFGTHDVLTRQEFLEIVKGRKSVAK